MKPLPYGLLLLILASCSSDKKPAAADTTLLIQNDFENTLGWVPDVDAVTRLQAHSGKYSIFVDSKREFSLTFDAQLSRIITFRPRSLEVEAWVYLTDGNATGELDVQLFDNNTLAYSDGIKLKEAAKVYNKWVKVAKTIVLPDSVKPTQHLRVFLWRADAGTPIYVDDIAIRAVK